jgi:probable F420-dependent oxidoreductase
MCAADSIPGSREKCKGSRGILIAPRTIHDVTVMWKCLGGVNMALRLGAVFPQLESGMDPGALRAYAQAVEGLGFNHIQIYDHVVGADTATRPGWQGPYTADSFFHEPFVLYGFIAGVTQQLGLMTGVIILPQRQTVLVAKQAAEVDVLTAGRLRLGVGVGWNPVEFQALGEDFSNRGARSVEQIAVMRLLWTQPVVTFHGRWHDIEAAGINPLPVQRPIPIWLGGSVEATLRRAGEIGDGWLPQMAPDDTAAGMVARLRGYAQAAGRDPAQVGIQPRLNMNRTPEDQWATFAQRWVDLGATHLDINTMGLGLARLDDHVAVLARVKAAIEG